MPGPVTLAFTGTAEVQAALRQIAERYGAAAGSALREEAEVIMTEAKRRTPVQYGTLRGSGHVTGPETGEQGDAEVALRFGGPAAGYAIYVHEDLEAHHETGEAKFLERPVMEAAPHLAGRVAQRMAGRMGA